MVLDTCCLVPQSTIALPAHGPAASEGDPGLPQYLRSLLFMRISGARESTCKELERVRKGGR